MFLCLILSGVARLNRAQPSLKRVKRVERLTTNNQSSPLNIKHETAKIAAIEAHILFLADPVNVSYWRSCITFYREYLGLGDHVKPSAEANNLDRKDLGYKNDSRSKKVLVSKIDENINERISSSGWAPSQTAARR